MSTRKRREISFFIFLCAISTSSAGLSKKIKLVRNERKGLRTNFPKWREATNQIIFNISFYQNNIIIKVFNYFWGGGGGGWGGHWDLRYGGISLFFLRYFGIFLEKLRYYNIGNLAVHGFAILDSKTAVIDKICLRYYGIECPPPSDIDRFSYPQYT